MRSDHETALETDHLEDFLETPAAPQSVVVVQYRNRGVPTWLFFPFAIFVTGASLFAYHRLVVEKERIQAARDRSLLALRIEAERAQLPLVRDNTPSSAVLPVPMPLSSEGDNNEVTPTAVRRAEQGPRAALDTPKSGADAVSLPPSPAAKSTLAVTIPSDPADQKDALAQPPTPVTRAESGITPSREKNLTVDGRPPVAAPAATLGDASKPAAPNDAAGSPTNLPQQDKEVPVELGDTATKPVRQSPTGRAVASDPSQPITAGPISGDPTRTTGPPNESPRENENVSRPGAQIAGRAGRSDPVPLAPLPTKEESERAIAEEAAKKEAERVAQFMNRAADLRARRYEEQVKFREELRELLRAKGNQAGPDIAKLDKRYAYEVESERRDQAFSIWRFNRMSDSEKVKLLRSSGIPETTILEFMCASLDSRIGTRKGPRDQNEVWVRAARQLLRSEPPKSAAGEGHATAAAAGAVPSQKTITSSPR